MPITIELTEFTANLAGGWVLAVVGATIFLLMCRAYLAVHRRIRSRSIFAEAFRHPPGHELRRRLRVRVQEIHALMAAISLLPLFFSAALLAGPGELMAGSATWYWLAIVLVVTAIACYHCYTLLRYLLDLPALRYELSADMAVSQGLERISRRDFTVFHDVRLGEQKLAKVIVGKQGVFALCLYVHPRSPADSPDPQTARFDGHRVWFPDGTGVEMVQQAQSQAKLAATRFSGVAGNRIKVCPVLAIPGWRIECAQQPQFPVVNECNIDMIASWVNPEDSLLDEEFDQIQALLSEACRDPRYKHHAGQEAGQPPASRVPA